MECSAKYDEGVQEVFLEAAKAAWDEGVHTKIKKNGGGGRGRGRCICL